MVVVHGLMVAGLCLKPELRRYWGPAMDEPPDVIEELAALHELDGLRGAS